MAIVMLPRTRNAFFNAYKPNTAGEGEPAYNGKIIIDPVGQADLVKMLDDAMLKTAVEKWGKDGAKVLENLIAKDKVCFGKKDYTDKTGTPYAGFADMFYVSWRNPLTEQPPLYGHDGKPAPEAAGLFYGGSFSHHKIELWAQDNQYGRRINAKLLGSKFAAHGERFVGSAPAGADDFAGLPSEFPDDGFGDADIPE